MREFFAFLFLITVTFLTVVFFGILSWRFFYVVVVWDTPEQPTVQIAPRERIKAQFEKR